MTDKQSWEEEFDGNFVEVNELLWINDNSEKGVTAKDIKSFISTLLQKEREEAVKESKSVRGYLMGYQQGSKEARKSFADEVIKKIEEMGKVTGPEDYLGPYRIGFNQALSDIIKLIKTLT
jgi:hypothetical protein